MNLSEVGLFVMGSGGLVTGGLALYAARANKTKIVADAGVSKATEKEIEQKAIALSEQTFQARESFWSSQVDKVKTDCQKEIGTLREEMSWLRVLIENHVPWDWEAIRQMKINGIDMRDPPTLNYLRSRQAEIDKEERDKSP